MKAARLILALAFACAAATAVQAENRYDPRLRFRTISTAHFDIYFHQGEEALARRLAGIAEDVSGRIAGELGRPRSRVHLVLVDQTDVPNGWANPTPYNLIEIAAASPRPSSLIGNTDDWLRLVFAHEYTHIVHLEKSRSWATGLRHVFGTNPVLFPNLFLPQWQTEGIATYSESALTGLGRVLASDFRLMLDRAAATGRLEPLDRASGGLVDWPSGNAAYLYGAYFHQYLADRYGPESLERLATATSGRAPYFGSGAFKHVYGRPLGELWKDFEASARPDADGPSAHTARLTHLGFSVRAPGVSAEGRVFYAVSSPHGFPALMETTSAGAASRQVATAYGTGQVSSAGRTLIFDQLELVRNVGLQSDLYALSLDSGAVRRLTHGARAAEPDISPDGQRIVCVVQQPGARSIAELDLTRTAEPAQVVSEPDTDYSAPRWSPDGTAIVAERRRLGGPSEIVVIDAATKAVTTLVSTPAGRNVQPAWLSRDTIVFASDREGAGFAIYAVDTASHGLLRLQDAGSGAHTPVLSPDRRTIAFIGYTEGGYDLFSLELDKATWTAVAASDPRMTVTGDARGQTPEGSRADGMPSSAYSPRRTLAPRLWSPTAASDNGEIVAGAMTYASDALGRHRYTATAEWSASRARPDWSVEYAYDRWWPTPFAGISDDTDPWRTGEVWSRELNLGVLLPVRRVRWVQATYAALHAASDQYTCADCAPVGDTTIDRRSARFGLVFNNAKSYGYSISPESGASLSATTELTRRGLGADGDATAWTADARAYVGLFPRHGVIAARFAAAASSGDPRVQQIFSAAGPGPRPVGFGFGIDAIGLLRGFAEDTVAAPRAAVVNVDYRFPLAYVQRGAGTLPFFLRTIHGAVFADAGHAWTGHFDASQVRSSFGAELAADTVLGYAWPITFASGIAWRHDPSGGQRGVAFFGRLGWAF